MEVRPIDANELIEFPYSEAAGTEEQIADWIATHGLDKEETEEKAKELCWMVIEGFINIIKTAPTLTPPPNEPLTPNELLGMDGEPTWWDAGERSCWGIISVDSSGLWAGIPFFRGRWRGANFEYDIEARGMTLYRRPPMDENTQLRAELEKVKLEWESEKEVSKACMSLHEKASKRLERALADLNGLCCCCIHGTKWEKAPDWSSLTFCEHLGGSIAAAGNAKRMCEHWQWRGWKEG